MSSVENGSDVKLSGVGMGLAVAIGGALSENLVLYGEGMTTRAVSPDVKIGALSGQLSSGSISAGMVGFGGGVAYYFMPVNIYVSASALAAWLNITDDSDSDHTVTLWETSVGFGLSASVGKEWWVSDNLGLGLVGQFGFASVSGKARDLTGVKPSWTSLGFTIGFSGTYN
jgi:hypothetical protein